MEQSVTQVKPRFTQPVNQVFLMLVVLGLVGAGTVLALPVITPIFMANPYLNGVIIAVFGIGVLACFLQVTQLSSAVRWIKRFAEERPGHEKRAAPRLLASLAALLRSRGGLRNQITTASTRTILDSVAARLDEARDITRYIVNLLVFLGLLGTFYGLATTVPAVVETIRSLKPGEGQAGIEVFGNLMSGLEQQLGGMGTAFASSLLGLAGSLVVGLLELFAGHGQNRFYRELEEWLSGITRLGYASGDIEQAGEAGTGAPAGDSLMEHLDVLHTVVRRSEEARAQMDQRLLSLSATLERVAHRLERDDAHHPEVALERIAQGQEKLIMLLEEGKGTQGGGEYVDAESRMRLRSIDVQLLRILEEMSTGRQESINELRSELSGLSRAIRQMGEPVVTAARDKGKA